VLLSALPRRRLNRHSALIIFIRRPPPALRHAFIPPREDQFAPFDAEFEIPSRERRRLNAADEQAQLRAVNRRAFDLVSGLRRFLVVAERLHNLDEMFNSPPSRKINHKETKNTKKEKKNTSRSSFLHG